jgi:hypothetical protein
MVTTVAPGTSQASADRLTVHSVAGGRFIVPMQARTKVFCAPSYVNRSVCQSGFQALNTRSFIVSKAFRSTSGATQRLAFKP